MSPHMFLQPVDVWLFRDGKPFSAGGDHRAESLFPPYPTVIQGAIRSKELASKHIDLSDKNAITTTVGGLLDFKNLRLKGPFLARREENGIITRFFPQPADAISVSVADHSIRPVSKPHEPPPGIRTNCKTPKLLGLDELPAKGESGLWLTEGDLLKYLSGETVTAIPSGELFVRETRVGVGIDSSISVSIEGLIYEVEYIRPQSGVGLAVEFSGYQDWPDSSSILLGGESRGAFYQFYDPIDAREDVPTEFPTRFKIYFATPTYFNKGWIPNAWQDFFDGAVNLVAAAVRKYDSVGGFDMTQDAKKVGINRPARRYVPAGSVYYFESDQKNHLKPGLIQNAITDFAPEIGFGQIIVKEW